MENSDAIERIVRLERENRRIKFLLLVGLVLIFALGAIVPQTRTLDTSSLIFRRADGQVVGELRVDGMASNDIALLDAKGVVRLSVTGLSGRITPPSTLLRIHDAQGRERITLGADDRGSASVSIGAANPRKITVDTPIYSATRAAFSVDNETPSLEFWDSDSKLVYSIPPKRR